MNPTFAVGDKIKSSPTSGDVVLMMMLWRGVVVEVRHNVKDAPDGCCYITVGRYVGELPAWAVKAGLAVQEIDTRRQLWANDIVKDEDTQ